VFFLPAADGALKIGENLVGKLTGGLFNQHPDDPKRYAANQRDYQNALQGNALSLKNLLFMSAQYGAAVWNQLYPGEPQGGWATDGPRKDAWNKYLQVTGGSGAPGGALTVPNTQAAGSGAMYAVAPQGKTLGETILDFFGLGPASQQQIAVAAGSAAGQQVSSGIVQGAVILGIIVIVVLVLRRR
jgi:hypothetical protein